MKPSGILFFLISLFAVLFSAWFFYPAEGMTVGGVKLRFPSYESYLADLNDQSSEINVDSVLFAVRKSYEIPTGSKDTLEYFLDYITSNPNRIYLPDNDYRYFDSVFEEMENSAVSGRVVRVLHLGDSQLEMDRISAVLRQALQERFGGYGAGMVPMIQRIPTVSVGQTVSGSVSRYFTLADSLGHRDPDGKYGPMSQFTRVTGQATFTFKGKKSRYSEKNVSHYRKISVLLGNVTDSVTLTLRCDSLTRVSSVKGGGNVSYISWTLPHDVSSGTIGVKGFADIYGIALDGGTGVTVDNVPLRGCDGGVFSRMDKTVMRQGLREDDTRMIIMQFGGNAMPSISSRAGISRYMERMTKQFKYFKAVVPDVKVLFVGPSDMGKKVDGQMVSWPLLGDLNDSLKVNCLKNGVAYWDTFNVMGGPGSMAKWVNHNPALAGPDYIHFTFRGAVEIGEAMSKSLFLYDDFRKTRKELTDRAVYNYFMSRTESLGFVPDQSWVMPDSLKIPAE